jgi:hypothetical protein
MNLLHQFRKDWSEFRWWIIGLWGLIAAYGAWVWWRLGSYPFVQESDAENWRWMHFAMDAFPLVCAGLLSARILNADHALSDQAFWRSRPLVSWNIGLAKITFLNVLILLPLCAVATVYPVWFDMDGVEICTVFLLRFFGLAGYGWVLYWVLGFSVRPAVQLGLLTLLALSYQPATSFLWGFLHKFSFLDFNDFNARAAKHLIAPPTQRHEAVSHALAVFQLTGLLLAFVIHYRFAIARVSVICALLLGGIGFAAGCYGTFLPPTKGEEVACRELANQRATLLSAETFTDREYTVLHTGINIELPSTRGITRLIPQASSAWLEKDGQKFPCNPQSWFESIHGWKLPECIERQTERAPNPAYLNPSEISPAKNRQMIDYRIKLPKDVSLAKSEVTMRLGDKIKVAYGEMREKFSTHLVQAECQRKAGYAWHTGVNHDSNYPTFPAEQTVDIRKYDRSARWPTHWEAGLGRVWEKLRWHEPRYPSVSSVLTPLSNYLAASVKYRSNGKNPERYLPHPWGDSTQQIMFGDFNREISSDEVELVIYEGVDLGTAWLPVETSEKFKFTRLTFEQP